MHDYVLMKIQELLELLEVKLLKYQAVSREELL